VRTYRNVFVIPLLTVLVGCSSYRSVGIPQSASDTPGIGTVIAVESNDNVRVTLKSGDIVTGKVLNVSEHELVLEGDGNYGFQANAIPVREIAVVEIEYKSESDKKNNKLAVWAGVLGVLTALVIGAMNSLSEL